MANSPLAISRTKTPNSLLHTVSSQVVRDFCLSVKFLERFSCISTLRELYLSRTYIAVAA